MEFGISLIIPVYNVAPYLRECLNSILGQKYTNWEAICVDDGSTDGCDKILDEYAAKDNRIRVVHQANAGVCAARNAALEVAKGGWIGFVDADDVISPEWIAVWYGNIRKNPEVQVVKMRDHRWVDGDVPSAVTTWGTEWYYGSNDISNYAASCITGYCIARYIIRRDVIGNQRFCAGVRINEDVIFVSKIMFSITSLCVCSYDGYYYRMRSESALHRGISDRDIVLFINGIGNIISTAVGLPLTTLFKFKRWAGMRIVTDILRCLVSHGIYPAKSIVATFNLAKSGTIIIDNLGITKYCCLKLLLHGRRIGFAILWMLFRLQGLYWKVLKR